MKIKILFSILLISIFIYSCRDDDDNPANFDHTAQSLLDDATIKEYLETHFYIPPDSMEAFGVIDTILNGETSLFDQVTKQVVNIDDVDYSLYYLKNMPEGVNVSSSRVDSVLVKYQGLLMDYSKNSKFDERILYTWFLLTSTVSGWSYGFPNFKSGTSISVPDMPLEYENTGKGMLFIPSGLAYRNIGTNGISPNKPIMFHIELAQVEEADHDNDTVSTNYENLNGDDDYLNDDTDGDNVANFVDVDDDGDRILTKFENADPNEDGNPNDAIDTDGDNIPNYLDDDDDGDGILSINENADPNNDGNPVDALDTDGDDIPDYLAPN
ncbi:MAG: peptidylprolyl isomerase [Flavobacteriaceae bacterium]|nr:peptidylprolyl isomerase [Flavobacteriaceae bacterium]